ncbi:hypothetical protein MLD38_004858 [Melastoma candidum]|uniref:Uncharacterized protein n=1 Tax=Melastoma candidum TaxID=119954 RepID=A0ACB9SAZ9_9MYRT|nr:hypothetical protein MLD38_004858 [Melastoma candidum]
MDGVSIGRKVDLKSCESYGKLATEADELFCSLLADYSDHEAEKPITSLLDETGEYTDVRESRGRHDACRMVVATAKTVACSEEMWPLRH